MTATGTEEVTNVVRLSETTWQLPAIVIPLALLALSLPCVCSAGGTLLEIPLDIRHAALEGNIAVEQSAEGISQLAAGDRANAVRIAFELAEEGLYEVKLLVVSPFNNPHFGLRDESNSTFTLAGQTRTWPIRTSEQPRYRNVPALFELPAGPHTLTLQNLPAEVRLREVMLVRDGILTESREPVLPPFDMLEVNPPAFPERTFSVVDYGAQQNNGPSFSHALQQAIEACHAAGGGTALVPPGIWQTAGPVQLKSNVRLHIEKGAEIHFSANPSDYLPPVFVRWAGIEMLNYSPLLYARDCENIAITGDGRLVGEGAPWWPHYLKDQEMSAAAYAAWVETFTPVEQRDATAMGHVFRPQFFQPIHCRNILVEDVTFESGPFWTMDMVYCENILVRRVKVFTHGPNGDGFCPDSSRNAIVEHCLFSTEDDAIAIHTGLNDDGRRVNRPTENVIVRHNRFSGGYWGACSLGSLTTAGIRNVLYHDNHHADMNHAFYFKSTRGRGGMVENIHLQDIRIERMQNETMTFTTFYSAYFGTVTGPIPTFRDIIISNVSANASGTALDMRGLPDRPLENFVLENVSILNASAGAVLENIRDLRSSNLHIQTTRGEAMTLTNCRNFIMAGAVLEGANGIDLRIRDTRNAGIVFLDAELRADRIAFDEGAISNVLSLGKTR